MDRAALRCSLCPACAPLAPGAALLQHARGVVSLPLRTSHGRAYDSHHRTAGIASSIWRRGGRLAFCGARAAKRTDAACILMSGAEGDPETQARLAGIRQGLSRFGWSEGRNVEIDYRYASASAEQARLLAKDLVAPSPR